MGILSIFSKKPKKEESVVAASEITSAADVEEVPQEIGVPEDETLIAVIMAAIAASMKKPVSGLKIVSFKQRGKW